MKYFLIAAFTVMQIATSSHAASLAADKSKVSIATENRVGKKAIQPGKNLSAAIAAGDFVFLSGTIAIGSAGEPIKGIRAQTEQVLEKLKSTLADAGLKMSDVVKTSVFIRHPNDFEAMNEVYRGYFPTDPPARTTVVVGFPNTEVLVEIEMIAYRGE